MRPWTQRPKCSTTNGWKPTASHKAIAFFRREAEIIRVDATRPEHDAELPPAYGLSDEEAPEGNNEGDDAEDAEDADAQDSAEELEEDDEGDGDIAMDADDPDDWTTAATSAKIMEGDACHDHPHLGELVMLRGMGRKYHRPRCAMLYPRGGSFATYARGVCSTNVEQARENGYERCRSCFR